MLPTTSKASYTMPTSHRYFTLILALAALISPTPSTAALAAGEVAAGYH